MKYCFMILALCVLFCACGSKKDNGYYSYKTDGVLEEEFDLLIAPNMDYTSDIPYEQQIKNNIKAETSKYSKTEKPKAKPQKLPSAKK